MTTFRAIGVGANIRIQVEPGFIATPVSIPGWNMWHITCPDEVMLEVRWRHFVHEGSLVMNMLIAHYVGNERVEYKEKRLALTKSTVNKTIERALTQTYDRLLED